MLIKNNSIGEIMDKKIILSIVIVALIGIVAATYQINKMCIRDRPYTK